MIESFAPGKLYIAGEYAVVEPGHPAILVAVDRFVRVFLRKAKNGGTISASQDRSVQWQRAQAGLIPSHKDPFFIYVLEAVNTVEGYAREAGIPLSYYDLEVRSELESPAGIKYGLGSSAAVIVATVKALSQFYGIKMDQEKLFKLASLVQLSINSNTSAGDLAASVYGGWIKYTSFFKDWILSKKDTLPLNQLVAAKWPGFSVEYLKQPAKLQLLVGWMGKSASSLGLVSKMRARKNTNKAAYNEFLKESKDCVLKMTAAFRKGDILEIQRQIQVNRNLLLKLSFDLQLEMETPLLAQFSTLALQYGGAAKFSGAGGGDCGIALFKKNDDTTTLLQKWAEAKITYLPLRVYEGVNGSER